MIVRSFGMPTRAGYSDLPGQSGTSAADAKKDTTHTQPPLSRALQSESEKEVPLPRLHFFQFLAHCGLHILIPDLRQFLFNQFQTSRKGSF